MAYTPQQLQELIAAAKARKLALQTNLPNLAPLLSPLTPIQLNAKQQEFATYISQPHRPNCILTGAAGTGKTTAIKNGLLTLLRNGKILPMQEHTSWLHVGTPSIVSVCYTRRATRNLKNNMPVELQANCLTIHKLLEFKPVIIYTTDANGIEKKSMVFEPTYHAGNKLPKSITTIVMDEVSMIPIDLYNMLIDALPNPEAVQFIMLGDIQQLAPVFGDAIFGYKLNSWHTIELTEVYRNQGAILNFAHRILEGAEILPEELTSKWQVPNELTIARWKPDTLYTTALNTTVGYLEKRFLAGTYNPLNDMVITCFRKEGTFSCTELSIGIAEFLDKSYGANAQTIVQIVAGYFKVYFAKGDYVAYNKEDYIILDIEPNKLYTGKLLPDTSTIFTRHGQPKGLSVNNTLTKYTEEELDDLITKAANDMIAAQEDVDTVNAASHTITLLPLELYVPGKDVTTYEHSDKVYISSRSAINKLEYGYCTTVHSAQGLQAPRIFFALHGSQKRMWSRELLYTGVTRAQKELVILCDNSTFIKGVLTQQNKGKTLQDKAKYFLGKEDKSKLIKF